MSATYRRDQAIANDSGSDRQLQCSAHGCPNRWAVDAGGGRLCTAHASADSHQWPEITQQQQWDDVERARMLGREEQRPQVPLTVADKRGILARVQTLQMRPGLHRPDPKAWAEALRDRETRGERLTQAQRDAWRLALSVSPPVPASAPRIAEAVPAAPADDRDGMPLFEPDEETQSQWEPA